MASCVVLALGAGMGAQERTQAVPPPPAAAATPQAAAASAGAPLPSTANVPSEKDFRKVYTEWLTRNILGNYPAEKDPAGAEFVRNAVEVFGSNPPFGVPPRLVREERTFDMAPGSDPGLLFMIGSVEPAGPRKQAADNMAFALLPQSKYPKFLSFLVALNGNTGGKKGKADPAQDNLELQYLEQALHDDSFHPDEMAALRWYIDSPNFQGLVSRNPEKVIAILKAAPAVAPWVTEYVQGVYFVGAAWRARGGDWASKVTQAGWQGFAENLAQARTHLVASWKENPHDPAAATEMITVCMGEDEQTDTMRSWFDKAVAADFDYIPAYSALRWGMRPRWGGSYDEMNAFGRECAATGRYDTMVPNERIATALDISDDSGDKGKQFEDPETAKEVLTVLDTYLALPHPCIRVPFSHTLAAIVADKAGRVAERDWHMAAINYKPARDAWLRKMEDLNELVKKAKADAGPAAAGSPVETGSAAGAEVSPAGTP